MKQSRQGVPRRLWLLNGFLTAAAAVVWVVVFVTVRQVSTQPHIAWWILAPIFFLSNRSGIRLYMTRTSFNSGIAEYRLILAFYFSTPLDLLLGFALAQVAVEVFRPVRVPWRAAFALSLHLFVMPLAFLVFRELVPSPNATTPIGWAEAGLAIVTYNFRLVFASTAMKFAMGKRPPMRDMGSSFAYSFGSASVGMLTAVLIAASPVSVIWLLPVVAAIGISSRIHGNEVSQRQTLEILAGADADTTAAMDFESTLHVVTSRLRTVFRARIAQITLYVQPPAAKAFRTTVDLDSGDELVSPVAADITPSTLGKQGSGVLMTVKSEEAEQIEYMGRHRINDAMLAPIVAKGRPVGYIIVGGHADEKDGAYKQASLTALQSLATQTAQLLENRQLATSLAELSQREAELAYRAFHDPLTGLATRALLVDRLGQLLAGPRQEASWLVAQVDVDGLALINSRFGRAAGDYVLVALAQALTAQLGEADTGARLVSDELLAIVRIDSLDAGAVARDIAAALAAPKTYGTTRLETTVCFGGTVIVPSDPREAWEV